MSIAGSDVAAPRPPSFPDTGLGRGWEPAVLTGATLLLVSFGLVNLYSASSVLAQRQGLPDTFYVLRQMAGVAVGLLVLVGCAGFPYRWWRLLVWPLLAMTWVALLLLVSPWTTGIAPEVNGARRWLHVAGIAFQPSEAAKLVVILWSAHLAVKKREHFQSLSKGLLPFLLIWGAITVPVLVQPDLSTAFVITVLGAVIVFAAGARLGHFAFVGAILSPFLLSVFAGGFRRERLLAFRDLDAHLSAAGYQVQQSLIALGSGGVTGVGFGEGRQKFGFLPEPHNDFIFSMIGEEWGLLGVVLLAVLYTTVILIGFRVARRAGDAFGQLVAIGITSMIALHAVLHMAVGLGVVPPTGLSLPLVSYGRSNLLVTLAGVGILISIARGRPMDVDPEMTA